MADREREILRDALREHVKALAVDIGPRTPLNGHSLVRAASYIHSVFDQAGLFVREQNYQYYDQRVTNVLASHSRLSSSKASNWRSLTSRQPERPSHKMPELPADISQRSQHIPACQHWAETNIMERSMAKVLIIGASRGIGLETVRAALRAGHAFARWHVRQQAYLSKMRISIQLSGDALDRDTIRNALQDVDVVIQTLGVDFAPNSSSKAQRSSRNPRASWSMP